MSSRTIYNVISDLRIHGYTLSIDVNSPKSLLTTLLPDLLLLPALPNNLPRGRSRVAHMGRLLPSLTTLERRCQGRLRNTTLGRLPKRNLTSTPRDSQKTYPGAGLSKQDVIEIVGEAMKQVVDYVRPAEKRSTRRGGDDWGKPTHRGCAALWGEGELPHRPEPRDLLQVQRVQGSGSSLR